MAEKSVFYKLMLGIWTVLGLLSLVICIVEGVIYNSKHFDSHGYFLLLIVSVLNLAFLFWRRYGWGIIVAFLIGISYTVMTPFDRLWTESFRDYFTSFLINSALFSNAYWFYYLNEESKKKKESE